MDDTQKSAVLADIVRASDLEWRRAVLALCPGHDLLESMKRCREEGK